MDKKRLANYPDVMGVKDVCRILDISQKTAYSLLQKGIISHVRIGRVYKVPKKCLYRYLESASTQTDQI